MPTIVSHVAIPLAIGLGLGRRVISSRLLVAGLAASILPDLDVVAFRLGIAYSSQLGHRGFSHSLLFAALVAALAALFANRLKSARITAFAFVLVSAVSHGLLDMLTTGGLGIACLWPFSEQRFFFPVQVVRVSPLSIRRFFGPAGMAVFTSELLWIWLPAAAMCAGLVMARKSRPPRTA